MPKGKVVRRFGTNIYGNPKFDRLLAKKPHAPGMHGANQGRRKISEYAKQLIEKQKLKYTYGMGEKQFRVLFQRALQKDGVTGETMMIMLESRLDNVIYRMGFASTRDAAKQLVTHGHIKVNGRRVNIPSYSMREGDVVTVKDSNKSQNLARRNLEESASRETTDWVFVDKDGLAGQVMRLPLREEIPTIANEQLVVELYSK
jgi:small subunit ribosomal protein S4